MFDKKCSRTVNVRMGPQNRLVVFHRLEIRGSAVTGPVKRQGWTDKRDKHPWQLWFTFIEILKIFNHDNPKHVHFLYILPQTRPPYSTLTASSPFCWLISHDSWVMTHCLSQFYRGYKLTHIYISLLCGVIKWIFEFSFSVIILKKEEFHFRWFEYNIIAIGKTV